MTAAFDIGTTAVKAVVADERGTASFCETVDLHTISREGRMEQEPEEWYRAFLVLSAKILGKFGRSAIEALIFSGQMQDVIPVSEDGMALRNAILYSDGRAGTEAENILKQVGETEFFRVTGNHLDGSIPLAKMVWIKEREPWIYEKTAAFLISSKDYVIARLTGNLTGDVTACSTAGAMDLEKKAWSESLIRAAGLDGKKFPKLLYAHEPAGTISKRAAAESGYREGTEVFAGTGDAGATTLASGILNPGEYNINLGTSGWVAAVSGQFMGCGGGGFNLAAMEPGKYINVVPYLNGGNVHRFVSGLLTPGEGGEPDFDRMSGLLEKCVPGSRGVMCLPYLAGERFPVMDSRIRASFIGISQDTRPEDMAGSALEGVAFSIRQGMELMAEPPRKITLIGGGAREKAWCRILCDVMGKPIYVYEKPDLLPALAIASSVMLARGSIQDYGEFIRRLQDSESCTVFRPRPDAAALYDRLYDRYKMLYPAVKGLCP